MRTTARVLVSHACASVGMSLPWPLLLVLVAERTDSAALLGATGAARMLPYVALSWAAGRFADRPRRDRVVRATLAARVAALGVAALALSAGHLVAGVLACTAAVALATPAYPALAAAVPSYAGPRTARVTELLVTVEVASFVVGPALGGLLLAPATRGWVPVLSLALVAVGWWTFHGVRLGGPVETEEPVPSVGWLLTTSTEVWTALVVVVAVNLVDGLLAVGLVPVASRLWQGGATAYGVATAAVGLGALAGPLLPLRGPVVRRVRTGLVLVGLPLLVVAASPALAPALVPLALVGAASVQVEAAATGLVQEAAPDRLCASVLGVADTAMVAAGLVGALVGPALADLLGARAVLLLPACVVLVATLVAQPVRPRASNIAS